MFLACFLTSAKAQPNVSYKKNNDLTSLTSIVLFL